MDDMRKNMNEFYEFLKSYDYIEATTRIKSSMYDNALKLMQREKEVEKADAIKEPVEENDDNQDD